MVVNKRRVEVFIVRIKQYNSSSLRDERQDDSRFESIRIDICTKQQ